MTRYDRTEEYTGTWDDRSHWNRQWENLWQQQAIGNIENFLTAVDWDALGREPDLSDYLQTGDISGLQDWQGTATGQLSNLEGGLGTAQSDISALQNRLNNWDTTTEVGDVQGLDDILSNLQSDYQSDIQGVESQLGDYLRTGDFNTRMTDNLNSLGDTLRGEFGDQIGSLDLEGVRQSIADQGGDLSRLTSDFAGISTDMDWLQGLDLGELEGRLGDQLSQQGTDLTNLIGQQGSDLTNLIGQQGSNFQDQLSNQQTQWRGDLTDLQNILESGRGEALANLESDLGRDRAADLLNLRQQLEDGRLSDIQGMAGNLRQEFGDQVFDLSDTFDERLGDVQTSLGGDISQLFESSGSLQSGLDTLTSGLGTTTQQLEALSNSFGDYQTDSATNLANVEAAFIRQLGDQGTDFTAQLGDLQSSTAADILGLSTQTAQDIAGARSEAASGLAGLTSQTAQDIAGARSEAAAGLQELGTTVTEDRQRALSDLDTTWSANLQAQDQRLQDQFQQGSDAFNKRLTDISSSMNYKMLGDSAQGVKIRRSRAYNTGRTRSGTGQLGRSMKISTLNI